FYYNQTLDTSKNLKPSPPFQVLVVQEKSGKRVWKLPTGVVNEGEDIWCGAVREVKEETGVDTEFVEVLCFRQSHQAFFTKSDLLFLCVLRPKSTLIEKQEVEIEAAEVHSHLQIFLILVEVRRLY
ncbi:nudix hydrolase 2, partial [Eucalyptus grandis]|uniref:nudix hydrolase 2 n=1 Tax=Eucalyptus grandis TaxID=71139 RepID=UPI00192EBFC0